MPSRPRRKMTVPLQGASLLVLPYLCWLTFAFCCLAQSTPARRSPRKAHAEARQAIPRKPNSRSGLPRPQDARNAGDAAAIALANQRLIALALRELAQIAPDSIGLSAGYRTVP